MSKSKGNVIYADDMVRLFGVDATRYFVLHEMPFENDGIITWDLVIERFNSDLANILGNLVNRTVSMSNKYFDGIVKSTGATGDADQIAIDADLKAVVTGTRDKVAKKMEGLRVADAITEVFALFRRCNKYIDETTPWVLAKDEAQQDRLAEVLYNLTESITIGASCFIHSCRRQQKRLWHSLTQHSVSSMTLTNLVFMRAAQRLQTNLRFSSAD